MKRGAAGVRSARPATRLLVVVASVLLLLGLLELTLRATVPGSRFLDKNRDCYWVCQLSERGPRAVRGTIRTDPRIGWRMRRHHRGADHSTNSRGLRGTTEYAFEPAPGVHRIVVLGDSFTFGLGVQDDETYAARIDASSPGTEAINLGVNGYGTDQQLLLWKEEGALYHPETVILGYYVPDFHRNGLTVRELPKPWFDATGSTVTLEGVPVPSVSELLHERLDDCTPALQLTSLLGAAVRRLRPEPEAHFQLEADRTRGILRELARSTSGHCARLVLVIIPHAENRAYPDHERIEALVTETCHTLDVPVLDLTDTMRASSADPSEALYGDNGHWTALGHALAAEQILAFLGSLDL